MFADCKAVCTVIQIIVISVHISGFDLLSPTL